MSITLQKNNCKVFDFISMGDIEDFIAVNGKRVYYKFINPDLRDKKKPLLVFLHEGLGCSDQWRSFPELISESVKCPALLFDRIRYGRSEFSDKPFDHNYMHDEAFENLPELFDKLNISERLILVGHSDGGTISLLFASGFPERVVAVITEADHVICEEITIQGVAKVVQEFEKGKLREHLLKHQKEKTDKLFYGWSGFWLSEEAKNWSIEGCLKDIKAPVLAIQGKDDEYGSAEQLTSKVKYLGGDVNILYLDNCGHVPHHEQKELVFNRIKNFIFEII